MLNTKQERYQEMVENNLGRLKMIARNYSAVENSEDLLQEMLYQLWRSFDKFKGESALSTWMYRVALNTAISFSRSRNKKIQLLTQSDVGLDEPQHKGDISQSVRVLEQFLANLGKIDRAILMLYLDDISNKEIATITGQTESAVGVRIHRMKQRFKQEYVEE
jgi:RNA polymerase sigma-70 factor (ECF subfamily)